jgi:predicted SAM-dependent methyltransferase
MLKLNLGCGTDIKEGFLNIDIRTLEGVGLVMDVSNLDSHFTDDSVDEIDAYDVLEHFSFTRTTDILKNWISKLKSGGKIIVRVPDLQKILTELTTSKLPIFEAQRLVYGGQDYPHNFHCAGFTQGMLEGLLLGCGCTQIIQVVKEPDSHNITIVALK